MPDIFSSGSFGTCGVIAPALRMMRNRRMIKAAAIAGAVLLVAFGVAHSSFRDPRNRIEHEHGIRLPASASSFECRGDASRGFLDRGASSSFIIASNDLGGFVSELKVHPGLTTFIPGNSQYQIHAAWRKGKPMRTYSCASPTGDWLHVEVWPMDEARVGICLYTDWN
jgi:hypothetical protein